MPFDMSPTEVVASEFDRVKPRVMSATEAARAQAAANRYYREWAERMRQALVDSPMSHRRAGSR